MWCGNSQELFPDALSNACWLSIVYGLKDRNLKNLLVFSQKIEDLTFFFHRLSPNRGEKGKNGPLGPWQTPSANIEHVGVYFAKKGCKIEDGFTDILGFQLLDIASGRRGVLLGLNSTKSTHKFCSQKKNSWGHFHGAAISFLPLIWLYFNERIYEYGDKVKLLFLLAVNYSVIPLAVLYFIAIFALRQLRNDKVGQYET